MNIYIPLSILLVLLSFIVRRDKNASKIFLFVSFFILFIFAALRYDFGADYVTYLSEFKEVKQYGYDAHYELETLFGRYMSLFPSYTLFLVFSSLLWFASLFFIAKKSIEPQYYWVFLLYILFTEECVIDSLAALRSSLCMILFIFAVHFITRNKRLFAAALLVSCIFIHTSSLVFLPFILIGKKSKNLFVSPIFLGSIIAISIYTAFSGKGDFYLWLSAFISDNAEDLTKYTTYLDNLTSGGGYIIRTLLFRALVIIPFIYLFYGLKKENEKDYNIYYQIGLIACSLTLTLGSGMISRFLMVMNPFFIISLLRTIKYTKKEVAIVSIFCVLFVSIYSLYHSMEADYSVTFKIYKTIFSAPSIP